ncbi:uncharacterized protein B0H18DRAFT_1206806 [Fomitopsis serialis]|uniref:uncharacterized protein n=1 Tax=Fomitopsis serialis TaxID=139415 RepID=UPI002007D432|nr:uncharacterized protein B0H18DRAFT_1206806 [Neoantrodia serialis]KAH9936525.1 hypothetical protein B0H18DRAFT_1206806 [Neoantrodia serialis]
MDSTAGMGDPLATNLRRQTKVLLAQMPEDSHHAHALKNASTRTDLLNTLAYLLSLPAYTNAVAVAFRPILLDLCARWLHDQENELARFEALCLLLEIQTEIYPVLAAFLRHPNRQKGPLAYVTQAQDVSGLDASILHRQLLAYYRILQANRDLPEQFVWPIAPLSKLIYTPHPDNGVKSLAIRCLALQTGMMEGKREELELESIGSVAEVDCTIGYGAKLDGNVVMMDGWVMPAIEAKRITSARSAILQPQDYFSRDENETHEPIHPAEMSPFITNVHGVLMLRSTPIASQPPTLFVETPSAVHSLRTLALHHSLRVPTLLTSAPSSGKSLLLSQLASILHPDAHNQIITIHLADTSLDPRSLLGSYVSSPTNPGTFEWKEGVLVRAMREGKWVVFADIDRASAEVLGVIKSLVESLGLDKWVGGRAMLNVPNRGTVVAEENFAIYATRSIPLSRSGAFTSPTFFGAHRFHEIVVPAPSAEDLRLIVETKFRRLAGAAAVGLIRLWEAVKALGTASSLRDVGLRELDKLCTRVEHVIPASQQAMDIDLSERLLTLPAVFPNPTVREDIYLEARDVFFGAGATTAAARTHLEAVATIVAEHLAISPDRRDWLLHARTPEFDIERDVNGRTTAVRVGSIRLRARILKSAITSPTTRPFAMHKPAVQLLNRIATSVSLNEPVLLTGETGTGKTSAVTHLAALLNRSLVSLNLSNQTESSDLVGGFKPVDARIPGMELLERFGELFAGTFSRKKNARFEESVRRAVQEGKWKRAVGLWREAIRMAQEKIQERVTDDVGSQPPRDGETPRKRRKLEHDLNASAAAWEAFEQDLQTFEVQHVQGKSRFAFAFVEGLLVKALRSGDWILLDEINLASPETLECISSLLHSPTASITLTEQGSLEPVPRHPDFRLFACMNPATDVGKRDLPPNIRSRFTEIDVPPPDADKETLLSIVDQYIGRCAVGDRGAILDVAEFYLAVKQLADARKISDGSNHRPHFSMRTLARALTFAADMASVFSLRRALWEGCLMTFTMVLDEPSAAAVIILAQRHLLSGVRNPKSLLSREPNPPQPIDSYLKIGPFYLERGPLPEDPVESYIMTPSVEKKLVDLARIISAKRFPVLIEGPTSAGKTSSIEYLARRTGHRFVRINNHEHTDIQEYLGSYVSDAATGKLVFQDGLLVRALRNGDWIVLDELNLAPTDVLEALNRLLDDNRELVIPETQEVIRPHPHFMLFATQNPPGLYAGRKMLSRAFRNRFLEVHFDDVPQAELEPFSASDVASLPRTASESSACSESCRSDGSRHASSRASMDYQELAENGYMLLAERARREDDKAVVKEVIESIMKVRIDASKMYDMHSRGQELENFLGCSIPSRPSLVWTSTMQRLFILVARALRFNEPVLLVGETGCGKTSVCQLYAEVVSKALRTLNCHQNTETADLIGGLRPIRNRTALESETLLEVSAVLRELGVPNPEQDRKSLAIAIEGLLKGGALHSAQMASLQQAKAKLERLSAMFEWRDGPLVQAMRHGEVFLLDEISLADDSVLERINSVLEPERSIVLAERGGDSTELPLLVADDDFKLVATMNPGGDYGKKELSPALRNRFTEIWVPPLTDRHDFESIIDSLWQDQILRTYTAPILDFVEWLRLRANDQSISGIRDILSWVHFTNAVYTSSHGAIPPNEIFHHAAQMAFLDGLGSLPQFSSYSRDAFVQLCLDASSRLCELVPVPEGKLDNAMASDPAADVQLGFFSLPRGPKECVPHNFNLQAPTTRDNVMRVVRACQLSKPVLLEGSPGVGKTSLVTALANLCGHQLCRINLSDQTDIVDLFGSDLPVEGGEPGQFAWKDAEFLRALQEGHWVLLDEMNLAPQAILEGLNAVLDHRGTVYIPELGRSFARHPSFRIFAAQNPLSQGGGRKGLPKSFVNRFTKVYVQELTPSDLLLICRHIFPNHPEESLRAMISYTTRLSEDVAIRREFGRQGGPWEFNLRDVIRWATLLKQAGPQAHPSDFLLPVFLERFRSTADRDHARKLFQTFFSEMPLENNHHILVTASHLQLGYSLLARDGLCCGRRPGQVLQARHATLETLGACIANGWLTILTGDRGIGKTSIVRLAAYLCGKVLHELQINSATDSSDILGSFEEVDSTRRCIDLLQQVSAFLAEATSSAALSLVRIAEQRDVVYSTLAAVNPTAAAIQSALQAASVALNALGTLPEPWCAKRNILCTQLDACLASTSRGGTLEWVDGPIVRALQEGHWVLLDGANLCNPSVLDRLNSLCELGGSLTLNERGQVNGAVHVVEPHPNFRLFMSVDPQYGELSRAMRNRGLEISLVEVLTSEDRKRVLDHLHLPVNLGQQEVKTASLAYEACRRGLSQTESATIADEWPNSQLLGADCPSASNAQIAPSMGLSQVHVHDTVLRSVSHFVAASMAPLYSEHLSRFIRVHMSHSQEPHLAELVHIVEATSHSHISRLLCEKKGQWDMAVKRTTRAILAQPLGTLKPPTHNAAMGRGVESDIENAIHQLRLLVSVELDHDIKMVPLEDEFDFRMPERRGRSDARRMHAVRAAQSLVESIRHGARTLLDSINIENVARTTEAGVMTQLVTYSRHLRTIIRRSPLDYSALQVFVKWVVQASAVPSVTFNGIHSCAQLLEGIVSLTSGLLLVELWTSLAPLETSAASKRQVDRLALTGRRLLFSSNNATEPDNLETAGFTDPSPRILELMSLWTLPQTRSTLDDQNLTHVTESIVQNPSENDRHNYSIDARQLDDISLNLELTILSRSNAGMVSEDLDEFLEFGCRSLPLPRLIPYQQIKWAVNTRKALPVLIMRAQKQWFAGVWEVCGSSEATDPRTFVFPVELHDTILTCAPKEQHLNDLQEHELVLRRRLQTYCLRAFGHAPPRTAQLAMMLAQTVFTVLRCTATLSDSEDASTERLPSAPPRCSASISDAVEILGRDERPGLEPLKQQLLPMLQQLISTPTSEPSLLGRCWIALAKALLQMYVPDAPVDPAAMQRCAADFWSEEKAFVSRQLDLHVEYERRTSGLRDSDTIQYLRRLLAIVERSTLVNTEYQCPKRDDVARLHSFWTETTQLMTQVLPSSKLETLMMDLKAQAPHAMTREVVIQESLSAFNQRLDTIYPDFVDISGPIQLALLYMKLGIHLVAVSSRGMGFTDQQYATATRAALAFPSVKSAELLRQVEVPRSSSTTAVEPSLAIIAGVILDVALGSDLQPFWRLTEAIFEQIFGLWAVGRSRNEQAERESQSLYRHQNDALTEANLEEEDFLSLFPQYEDVLEDNLAAPSTSMHAKRSPLLNSAQIVALGSLHKHLFTEGLSTQSALDYFMSLRRTTVVSLISQRMEAMPDKLDQESRAYQLSLLHEAIASFDSAHAKGATYNFYIDANFPQSKRAVTALRALQGRLAALIQDWPDQMVLQHLQSRCQAILRLDLSSPVAKILSALEQLVMHIEDWEMYANRENTLKTYQQTLTGLIVEWRRLELSSWQGLLQSQATNFAEGVFDWWFRLYEATVRGVMSASAEEANGQDGAVLHYLDGLMPLLDEFIIAAPIGQYEARLDMLHAFSRHVDYVASGKSDDHKQIFNRVHRILRSTWRYYTQFAHHVRGTLSCRQAELEKEVRDYIKLASWKDVNVHALKQSAQKSHKQLYKVIRKFRDVLRQPVQDYLKTPSEDIRELQTPREQAYSPTADDVDIPTFPPAADLPLYLANLNTTYRNFRGHVSSRVATVIASIPVEGLDELAKEAIVTSAALAKSSPPSHMQSAQRVKFLKSLRSRKRRAWSDLLKELKKIGLSVNVKPELLEQLRNLRWLREQEVLAFPGHCEQDARRADDYFGLRESCNEASHYWSLDSRWLLTIAAGNIAKTTVSFERLHDIAVRLQTFTSAAVTRSEFTAEQITNLKDYMCRLVHALEEMLLRLREHNGLRPGIIVAQEMLDEMQLLVASSREHAMRLSELVRKVKLVPNVVLSTDEFEVVNSASKHLRAVGDALQGWFEGPIIVRYFAEPIHSWLMDLGITDPSSVGIKTTSTDNTGVLISALLLSIQALHSLCPPTDKAPEPTADSFVHANTRLAAQITMALNIDGILEQSRSVLTSLGSYPAEDSQQRARRVLPFLTSYMELARHHLDRLTNWTAALFKLDYVVCSIMLTLAKDGFCQPPEAEDNGEGAEGTELQTDGTGLGEGAGAENVSKDIQDESQVEGLQGEEEGADEQVERAEEGNALEMSEDFEGQMQDAPEGEDEGEGEDGESDAEPEEQIGDLDALDPSAIDEKLWGDEAGPQDTQQDGGSNQDDRSSHKQDAEMVAKDGDEAKSQPDDRQHDQDNSAPDVGADDDIVEEQQGGDGQEADNGPEGAPLDEHVREADTLDLPDDMDLDAGKDNDQRGMDDDLSLDEGDEPDEETMPGEDDPATEPPTADEADNQQHMDDLNQAVDDTVDEKFPVDEEGQGLVAKPDLRGDGQDPGQARGASSTEADEMAMDVDVAAQEHMVQGTGRTQQSMDTPQEMATEQNSDEAPIHSPHGEGGDSAPTTQSQQGGAPSAPRTQLDANPLRSLGDALREISRHLDDILESTSSTEPPRSHPDAPGQMEHLQPDDTADHTQALGPAMQEEEIARLNELKFAADDPDRRVSTATPDEEAPVEHVINERSSSPQHLLMGSTPASCVEGTERALTHADISPEIPGTAQSTSVVPSDGSVASQSLEELSKEVEIKLKEWQADGQPSGRAGDVWRLYESLTHDLSYALCEQLRLILEPTQATRLKGDYRTGKRINMKKIIPYIASEFTKDKIWLRRTRPSQREYQVLIALDDSRSMAESHSVHLAYETLALVSKALSRLEVGDIAIAKFGELVEVLHGFEGGPFTDHAGARIIDAFHFDQKATQVLSLVESSIEMLERAKERRAMGSASAADLWQLEIIISDGICQDHEKLRTVLRKAEEQRIMVVFIILDSLHARSTVDASSTASSQGQDSILQMNQVAYRNVDGRMDLHVERYLDTFPFEYYVVLRDVEALPDVLAGTLKQFFERIAED